MQFHIHNILYAEIDSLSRADLDEVRRAFRYPNPRYHQNVRLGFANFGVPPEISLVEETECYVLLPRGVASTLCRLFPNVEFVDETITDPANLGQSSITLKPFQEQTIEAALRKNQGLLCAPTGSGKTVMGIEVIVRRSQKSLVLCHTRDLLAQWRQRFRDFAGVEPGVIDAEHWDIRDVTVGMVQSLHGKRLDSSFVNDFGLVMLDEAHHAPAYSFQNLMCQFPARYRYGLTATPERTDGLSFLLHGVVGPILYEIDKDELFECGHIMKPTIRAIHTNHYAPGVATYNGLLDGITSDEKRNSLILAHLSKEAEAGHYCLILSERVRHVQHLHKLFQEKHPEIPSGCIVGDHSREHRARVIELTQKGEIHALFATRLAEEGLDIQRLDRLFITCPIRSHNKITQQLGRILRVFPGKRDTLVYDFRDSLTGLAESQWHTRRCRAYEGYAIEEVPYGSSDHEKAA